MSSSVALKKCAWGLCDDEGRERNGIGTSPTKSDLGRAAWTVYYTMAANPSAGDNFGQWLRRALKVYPCTICRPGIEAALAELDADDDYYSLDDDGSALARLRFVKQLEDRINEDMKKPPNPCSAESLLRIYRHGPEARLEQRHEIEYKQKLESSLYQIF